MKNIIAHRGLWLEPSEQNTDGAFQRALDNGFGIETDIRDCCGEVVISHDLPASNCMGLDCFLDMCSLKPDLMLALNVKADGLQNKILSSDVRNPHFFFDMSVPDMLGYKQRGLKLYTRYSDIEPVPSLYNECDGVWLDSFHDEQLNIPALMKFLDEGKHVVLVSPELHKRSEKKYWQDLKTLLINNPQYSDRVSICTDFPIQARGFFNGG